MRTGWVLWVEGVIVGELVVVIGCGIGFLISMR